MLDAGKVPAFILSAFKSLSCKIIFCFVKCLVYFMTVEAFV